MKVYFTAAVTQRKKMLDEYKAIKKSIIKNGHQFVESYDVIHKSLTDILNGSYTQQLDFFRKWSSQISNIDIAVVETSFPSTIHIGLELGALIERGKPILCLYLKGKNPVFIGEFHSNKLIKMEYTLNDIHEVLDYGIEEVKQLLSRRFTMIMPTKLDDFLSKVVKEKGISRSEFIRDLLEREMGK